MSKQLIAAAVVCLCLAMTAAAGTLTTNASLATPPGYYNGAGGVNAGFTVLTAGNLELGLGAVVRWLGPAPEVGSNYTVMTGQTGVAGHTGASWGINYSVNANVDGSGHTSGEYGYQLTIADPDEGLAASFDPSAILDNAIYGSGGVNWGFQNSEAPSFGFISTPLHFDINAEDTYIVTLTATPKAGGDPIVNTITIDAQTPEPSTLGLMGSALIGIGALGRRLRRSK